jgi:geranylgeranyl diphosphate synthase, type I
MSLNLKNMKNVIELLENRGKKAVETAKQYVLRKKIDYEPLNEAIKYFMNEFWFDVLHPALISIACEAVGGNPEETTNVGAAVVLLAGGADIHDDVIDQSTIKEPLPTVFGKFGRDIAILAGDILLAQGLYLLHDACENQSKENKREILDSILGAYYEICAGEAQEVSFRGKLDISKNTYLDIIRHKVAAAEATTRTGSISGGGSKEEIDLLSHYGRTYGVLLALRDEFIDIYEPDELSNRVNKECIPLPILLALKDKSRGPLILELLEKEKTEETIDSLVNLTIDFEETRALVDEMIQLTEKEIANISQIKYCNNILQLFLRSTLEDL